MKNHMILADLKEVFSPRPCSKQSAVRTNQIVQGLLQLCCVTPLGSLSALLPSWNGLQLYERFSMLLCHQKDKKRDNIFTRDDRKCTSVSQLSAL